MSATHDLPHQGREHRPGRVVLGVSTSVAGLQAARYAVLEARCRGCELVAVRAFGFQPPWFGPDVVRIRDELRAQARRGIVEAFELAMGGFPADVVVLAAVTEARADSALVDAADRPDDVLVLGRHCGRVRVNWLVRSCVRRAVCPVVVVPPRAFGRDPGRRVVRRLMREIARDAYAGRPHASGRS